MVPAVIGWRKVAAKLTLAAYCFAGVLPVPGLVLCIEADGAVALEFAALPDCCSANAQGAPRQVDHHEIAGSTTCTCVDIPLLAARDDSKPQRPRVSCKAPDLARTALSAPPWAPCLRGPSRAERARVDRLLSRCPRGSPRSRSVVLLI